MRNLEFCVFLFVDLNKYKQNNEEMKPIKDRHKGLTSRLLEQYDHERDLGVIIKNITAYGSYKKIDDGVNVSNSGNDIVCIFLCILKRLVEQIFSNSMSKSSLCDISQC